MIGQVTPQKFVLDGDFGIDDALALLYLASEPGVEIIAVGSVHGNAEAAVAATNALSVLDLAGLGHVPVAVGAGRPLAQPLTISAMVHGADGLGGQAPPRGASDRVAGTEPAAVQLVEVVRANPRGCTIVATGPLTNLALALLLDPGIVGLVERVVIMGGTVWAPGNVGPNAEANIAHDPEAADLVLSATWPVTIVGLDVTMSTWLQPGELERIQHSTGAAGRFSWSILQHYLGFYFDRHGRRGCPLHDPSAARLAVDPSLGRYLEVPVSVELRSQKNRGMLIADRREYLVAPASPRVRVTTEVDRDRLVTGFLDGLLGGSASG
jgi:purine nucleosidase